MSKNDDAVDIAEKYRRAYSNENLQQLIASSESCQSTRVEIVYEQFTADRNKFGEPGRTFHQVIKCNGDVVEWLDGPIDDPYPDVFTEAAAEHVNSHIERYLSQDLTDAAASVTIEAYAIATDVIEGLIFLHGREAATRALERSGAEKAEIEAFKTEIGETHKGQENRSRRLHPLPTEEKEKEFLDLIDHLTPIWKDVLDFFKANDYDPHCVRWIKDKPFFASLSEAHRPGDELLKLVFRRKEGKPKEFTKKNLARQHAAKIMRLFLSVERLRQLERESRKSGNQPV